MERYVGVSDLDIDYLVNQIIRLNIKQLKAGRIDAVYTEEAKTELKDLIKNWVRGNK